MWPYAEVRPKAMIPVGGKPIAAIQVDMLRDLGFDRIVIVGGTMSEQLASFFSRSPYTTDDGRPLVTVVRVPASGSPAGTAFSLCAAEPLIARDEPFLVLYGDTLLEKDDLARLANGFASLCASAAPGPLAAALVSPLGGESPRDWICCRLRAPRETGASPAWDAEIERIAGHPRDEYTHRFCAFAFTPAFLPRCARNPGIFTEVQVGMMPPVEGHLEMSLAELLADGHSLPVWEARGRFFDLDKPWHILEANDWFVRTACGALTGHELAPGASIDESAEVNGFVRLGENSRIGKGVVVNGNVIVGAGTVIENGAILQGHHMIGDGTYIGHYSYLAPGSTVGSRCVISHCAELDGMIMDNVYLYHYMEFYGIVGTGTDLGAATVCGTLRFDDGDTVHTIRGRKEAAGAYANAVYLGDYARTGVNAILMPGVKVGVYSVVGPGVVLYDDLPDRTIVTLKQELQRREWGPHRYGW
jgi:bifunctional UDP-N-acetylglucosamine pyrophosphorylase/glucosamine-1-phosphate N-acetyltransferase